MSLRSFAPLPRAHLLALGLAACALPACGDDDPAQDDGRTESSTSGEDPFVFNDAAADAYAQIDRVGMPAVGTAVIMSKDAYNQASPVDDAAGTFVDEITASVTALHEALDDDLMGAGVSPCAVTDCIAQAAPLVVPDTLKVDTTMPAGFPNGRLLSDPVIDVTLAVILLDLSVTGQDATSLVGTNPTSNDLAFGDSFPFLAERHVP